ncbi:hypothetical protein PoHVEF18_009153 [Penicillium ochrochloron]
MAPMNMSQLLANATSAASSFSSCGPVPLASVASLAGLSENSVNRLHSLGILVCIGCFIIYLVTIITNYYIKMKEIEWSAFLAAAQSDEQTRRLSYLLGQTHDRPLLLVYKNCNNGDAVENVTVGGKILLVRIPLGGNKPRAPSPDPGEEDPQGQ